jgi:hypothetical protein
MLRSAQRPAVRYDFNMATVTRSYRIRAYPNGAQRRLLDRWFGSALADAVEGIRLETNTKTQWKCE